MIDLEHLLHRFVGRFDPESRYYWPLVAGIAAALAANLVWYYWKQHGAIAPAERMLRPWALTINLVILVWVLILVMAKAPFVVIVVSFGLNLAALAALYLRWLPPREAEWAREQRRLRYIPRPERRKRRRR